MIWCLSNDLEPSAQPFHQHSTHLASHAPCSTRTSHPLTLQHTHLITLTLHQTQIASHSPCIYTLQQLLMTPPAPFPSPLSFLLSRLPSLSPPMNIKGDGSEIYMRNAHLYPWLKGKTFSELAAHFPDSVVLGWTDIDTAHMVSIQMSTCVSVLVCLCRYVCVCVRVRVLVHVLVGVRVRVRARERVRVRVCACVFACVCTYVCLHVCMMYGEYTYLYHVMGVYVCLSCVYHVSIMCLSCMESSEGTCHERV